MLFLDEPTTGLDPRSRLGMWDIINSLVGEGTTVLLTTQYLEEADQLADSISVIDDGKVIAEGTSDELKASIGGQKIELTLVSTDDTPAAVDILRRYGSGEPKVENEGRALSVNADDAPAALQHVLAECSAGGIRLFDAGMRRPTLDDVFLRLTGHMASADEEEGAGDEKPSKRKKRARESEAERR